MDMRAKLTILADAAKYDASCASSGSKRGGRDGALGNTTSIGICHSYTPDGRCVSLPKILLTTAFRITQSRGEVVTDQPWAPWMLATYHPSALLRVPDPELAKRMREEFTHDLQETATALDRLNRKSRAG
jgi:hypothetical protein